MPRRAGGSSQTPAAAQETMVVRPLFDARPEAGIPCIGEMSAGDSSAVPLAFWRLLQNVRMSNGCLEFRGGSSELCSGLGLTGTITILGAKEVTLNGTQYLVVAAHGSGSGYAAVFTVSLVDGTVDEITAGSGQYGNTRLGNNTDPVVFAVVPDKEKRKDYLVIQNGVVPPRVYDQAADIMTIHEGVPSPRDKQTSTVFSPTDAWTIADGTLTYTNSSARMTMADDAAPVNYIVLTIKDNVNNGDTTRNNAAMSPAVDSTDEGGARQICFWFEGDSAFINSVKFEIGESAGGTYYIVHDPSDPSTDASSKLIVQDQGNDRYILTCFLDHIDVGNRDALTHFKITWVDDTQTGGGSNLYVIKLLAIFFGGQVQATARYAASWINSTARDESAGVLQTTYYMDTMSNACGGRYHYKLPEDDDLYLRPQIAYANTIDALRDIGIDYLGIYRFDPGDVRYTLVKEHKVASYSGGAWSYVSGTSGPAMDAGPIYDVTPKKDKDRDRTIKEETDLTIPMARAMEYVSGRLWCGDILESQPATINAVTKGTSTVLKVSRLGGFKAGQYITISGAAGGDFTGLNGTWRIIAVQALFYLTVTIDLDSSGYSGAYTADSGTIAGQRRRGDIYFSEYKQFTRFSKTPRVIGGKIDQNAGSSFSIPGERVMAFSGQSAYGIDLMLLWTDRNLYNTGGTLTTQLEQLQRIGPHGTLAPNSIARFLSDVYWVDQLSQVRKLRNGQIMSLSRQQVDNHLLNSADITKTWATFAKDRLYIGFRPTGATKNTKILVYDERVAERYGVRAGWSEDALISAQSAEAVIQVVHSNTEKIFIVGSDSKVFRYDNGTTESDTNNVSIGLTTCDFAGMRQRGFYGMTMWYRLVAIIDKATNGTLTIAKAVKPDGSASAGTLSFAGASGQVFRHETPTSTPAAVAGNTVTITITGSAPGGTKIYFLGVEEDVRYARPD